MADSVSDTIDTSSTTTTSGRVSRSIGSIAFAASATPFAVSARSASEIASRPWQRRGWALRRGRVYEQLGCY